MPLAWPADGGTAAVEGTARPAVLAGTCVVSATMLADARMRACDAGKAAAQATLRTRAVASTSAPVGIVIGQALHRGADQFTFEAQQFVVAYPVDNPGSQGRLSDIQLPLWDAVTNTMSMSSVHCNLVTLSELWMCLSLSVIPCAVQALRQTSM